VKALRFSIFLFLFPFASSAFENIEWFDGSLILKEGKEVITGKVAVQPAFDLVLMDFKDSIKIYPAHKVLSLRYFDPFTKINKKFTVIQLVVGNFKASRLFEIVVSGEIPVLRRIHSTLSDTEDHATSYDYYLYFKGEVIDLTDFKQRVFSTIHSEPLKNHVAKEKLSLFVKQDIILIVQYYNKHLSVSADLIPG
jgi:hypothetical protein